MASANDNGTESGKEAVRPIVRVPRRRPDAVYARSGNVLLPLRFAERMDGWGPLSSATPVRASTTAPSRP